MTNQRIIKTPKFPKPEHKFFSYDLDNNLDDLAEYLLGVYNSVENDTHATIKRVPRADDQWVSSNSVTTVMWRDYNVFQMRNEYIYNLYKAVAAMTKEACEYYGEDFEANQFMVQGWFNINYSHTGKLDWHEHSEMGSPIFHGYYAVKAEPSETHYMIHNKTPKVNSNKNNRAILSETSHPHAMGDWEWEGPRITIAYDVTPLRLLKPEDEQHWTPLYA